MLRRFQTRLLGRFATLAGAIAFSALVSIVMLPFSTKVLHAGDFGTYAVLMSIVALVGTAIDGGASILLPAHYGLAPVAERGRMLASLAGFALLGSSAASLLLVGASFWHQSLLSGEPGHLIILITAILMPLRVLTSISNMSFSVTGRTSAIAIQIVCQAAVVFGGTLIPLFGFEMGGGALFVGAVCGQAAALFVCLATLNRHGELALPSRYWLRQALTSQPTTATVGFMEGARTFGESLMLSSASGLAAVGILSHARLYLNLQHMFASAVAQNTWAKSLQDAHDPRATFETTRKAWAPVQIVIACAAVVFVFLGRDIVAFISNGKLTDAGDYIPVVLMMALIQNSEQPALATVYAFGRGASAAWFRSLLVTVTLAALYPAILFFGIKGLLVAAIMECCAFRVFLRRTASLDREEVPFQDQIGAFGCLVIVVAMIYQHVAAPALAAQIAGLALGIAAIAMFGGHAVRQTFLAVKGLLFPLPEPHRL